MGVEHQTVLLDGYKDVRAFVERNTPYVVAKRIGLQVADTATAKPLGTVADIQSAVGYDLNVVAGGRGYFNFCRDHYRDRRVTKILTRAVIFIFLCFFTCGNGSHFEFYQQLAAGEGTGTMCFVQKLSNWLANISR